MFVYVVTFEFLHKSSRSYLLVLSQVATLHRIDCLGPPPVCHIKNEGIRLSVFPKDLTSKLS